MGRNVLIEFRRDTAANWTSVDPTLAHGEPGFETDTGKLKIGDGATAWTSLSYIGGGGASSPLTTKGDLWGFDTANDRIPVGTDGEVLTADSTAALGVSWQTAPAHFSLLTNPAVPDLIFTASGDVIFTTS